MTAGPENGLVLVSYGSHGVVETANGERIDCTYRRSVGRPVCGDRVGILINDSEGGVVSELQPRSNEFMRANAKMQKQVIAANLDQVLIVVAPRPEPSRDLVERYLVAVHSLGIDPVIVLNKADLLTEEGIDVNSPLSRLEEYRALGYPVFETSCTEQPGVASIETVLENRTSILVGQSGVGKSSMVNALLPDLELQTGALSRVTGKGTHTTTTTIMYRLPCGGRLIDSPGVWEYGLWQMDQRELSGGFIDIQALDGNCRFNDCSHRTEPGCSVREAAESGSLRDWRYRSYLRLLEQNAR